MIMAIIDKKGIRELMEGIAFLPLHSGNKKVIGRVKRVWIGRNLSEKPIGFLENKKY